MLESLLIVLNMLAHDLQLPFGSLDSVTKITERLQPEQRRVPVASLQLDGEVPAPAAVPFSTAQANSAKILAERAIILDATSATVLLEKRADEVTQPASIAKLMTALVAIRELDSLDEYITVPSDIANLDPASSVVGLHGGDRLTGRDLLKSLLVASGNDAAVTLAHAIAGSEKKFVTQMNENAQRLGLTNTTFANATGLDAKGNQSTARDLAFLLLTASRQPLVREFTTSGAGYVTTSGGDQYYLKPTDTLLSTTSLALSAAKTGTTDLAGESFAVMAEQDGHELIAVVLDSPDRFTEAESLLSFGFDAYVWSSQIGSSGFAGEAESEIENSGG
jgi:D-alanyl-D-alanine carboxypeptidase